MLLLQALKYDEQVLFAPDWPATKLPQALLAGEVHLWAWPLNEMPPGSRQAGLDDLIALLDREELARLWRFHFERHRVRFAIAHAQMRRILGAYLERPPETLRFRTGEFGKPEIAGDKEPSSLRFNLSHSETVAMLAIVRDGEVGVDVEDIRPIEPEVAGTHFSAAELSALGTLRGDPWLLGFYQCWTRKEAILKAEGVGLNTPLDAFDVSLLPGEAPQLLAGRPAAGFRQAWQLHSLSPAEGCVGALAVDQVLSGIRCFRPFG